MRPTAERFGPLLLAVARTYWLNIIPMYEWTSQAKGRPAELLLHRFLKLEFRPVTLHAGGLVDLERDLLHWYRDHHAISKMGMYVKQ
jgi:hypothetical protein